MLMNYSIIFWIIDAPSLNQLYWQRSHVSMPLYWLCNLT